MEKPETGFYRFQYYVVFEMSRFRTDYGGHPCL